MPPESVAAVVRFLKVRLDPAPGPRAWTPGIAACLAATRWGAPTGVPTSSLPIGVGSELDVFCTNISEEGAGSA